MRTLFVKILVWFWLAYALVLLAHFLSTEAAMREEPRPHFPPGQQALLAQVAVEKLEREGQPAAAEFLDNVERTTRSRAFVFDGSGQEVTGRQPLPAAQDAARGFNEESNSRPRRPDGEWHVRSVTGKSGGQYLYVSAEQRPPRPPFPFLPHVWWAQLLAFILTAGIVCYLLARYLSAPIVKLRDATRKLAEGDLTARVGLTSRRRDELVDLGRDFDVMAERLENLMTSQQRLLHDISHELRSPLTRLNIALELARQGDPGEASWAMDRIELESQRLNALISQLLTLARMESSSPAQARTMVNLEELVSGVAMDADFEARTQGKAVRVVRSESCLLHGDEQLLRSAIENVVRNAVLYTPEGTDVEIGLCHKQVQGDEGVLIRVRDQGNGVPSAALADIFRPFYRVGDARDRQTGGTGLGLSISQRAVEVHGGTITASNAAGGGLLVEIFLPTLAQAAGAGRPESPVRLPAQESSPA
jgi:signal transduction histidine kinase